MKFIRGLLLFLIVFIAVLFIGKGIFVVSSINSSSTSPVASTVVSNALENPEIVRKIPVRLRVPSLNIEAQSESVGMDDQGRMDVPKNIVNVAWYQLGVTPGEKGNAVFAGHYDKPDGSPAVFYNLKKLESGDEIIVEAEDGTQLTFMVTEIRVVKLSEFPLQEVFGETNKTRVNLITCGGIWDRAKKEYSERSIVFSELKNT